ncbi:MAG: HAD-IIIC family phosphatase [Roseburia sp.]|nr:HAD-IIIC family phosphatase [Roseburia sp.]
MGKVDVNGEMRMRIAVLSNVNMNFVIRSLQDKVQVYEPEGYGNELGILMNPKSPYHAFGAQITFLVMDLMELLNHELLPEVAIKRMEDWFAALEGILKPEMIYYVSDTRLWGAETKALAEPALRYRLEQFWRDKAEELCRRHFNLRILPYGEMLGNLGEEKAYSPRTWYLGKILLSGEAQRRLGELILESVRLESYTPKKVLALDLDNTLWGGLAAETEHTPIQLSEEHEGLAYKNLQRVLLQMQKQGVLLVIVSKNNEEDAMDILEKHPHMVLSPECFAAREINWRPKHENLRELSRKLNLGLDSFVFWDDSPAERGLVAELMPEVVVPEFPTRPEELAEAMAGIYRQYFKKPRLTGEDLDKTSQYAANAKRDELRTETAGFEEYLRKLDIVLTRVEPGQHVDRLLQLLNKTNQFNLTTIRHTYEELSELLSDTGKKIYFYKVEDCFGDNGLVAALILEKGKIPVIREFVMSCRVMGRNIEQAILAQVEQEQREAGCAYLRACFVPTAKNKPVAGLYEALGYERVKDRQQEREGQGGDGLSLPGKVLEYELELNKAPERTYFARMEEE